MYSPNDSNDWDPPLFDDAVLVDHKHDYIKKPKHYGEQTPETCTVCKIALYDPSIPSYEICRNDRFIIFLNLYPYTNAHLLISPVKHIIGYEEFSSDELMEMGEITKRCIKVLKYNGNTESINAGWNQGNLAGGSIKHFHMHLIPRYPNELNFMEIIARTRPYIRSLEDTQKDLQKFTPYLLGDLEYDDMLEKLSH